MFIEYKINGYCAIINTHLLVSVAHHTVDASDCYLRFSLVSHDSTISFGDRIDDCLNAYYCFKKALLGKSFIIYNTDFVRPISLE